MSKDLTSSSSSVERQNILNNRYAIEAIRQSIGIEGMIFEDQFVFTKQMVAEFYEVDVSTIDRYLSSYADELKHNGYFLCRGKRLKDLKLQFAHLINEATKTTQLGLFNFRSFLNIGMLLVESEKAKQLRSAILDIVISTINKRTGGGTKYINQRDVNYLPMAIKETNYRKQLTSALRAFVEGADTNIYSKITNAIYRAVFKENAKEYREILRLGEKDNVRSTLYTEVLLVITSFENGVGDAIRKKYNDKGNVKLSAEEVESIITEIAMLPMQKPYLEDARSKMASRDFSFRDAFHGNLAEYLREVSPDEYEKFIGADSIDFDHLLEDNKDVLRRLKQGDDE